jgi:hypothetical protein
LSLAIFLPPAAGNRPHQGKGHPTALRFQKHQSLLSPTGRTVTRIPKMLQNSVHRSFPLSLFYEIQG